MADEQKVDEKKPEVVKDEVKAEPEKESRPKTKNAKDMTPVSVTNMHSTALRIDNVVIGAGETKDVLGMNKKRPLLVGWKKAGIINF